MLTFSFLILSVLKANRCYCVKCVRFFSIFCVSQCSVATSFRCDEKYNKDLSANLLPGLTVKKKLENWPTFAKDKPKNRAVCF